LIRVLYDISTLGLGHLSVGSRGGSYRADRHVLSGLVTSGACDVQVCANHSGLARQGAAAYLRDTPGVSHLVLRGGSAPTGSLRSSALVGAHRLLRRLAGPRPLPRWVRRGGAIVDRQVHPPVVDGSPPVDVFHSQAAPLPPRTRAARSPQRLLTVYDLSYLRYPEIYGPSYAAVMNAALGSLNDGDWVMTSSRATREELIERKVAREERIFVSPLAADPATFYPCRDAASLQGMRTRLAIPDGRYLLSVNSPDPRKNLAHAVQAFGRLLRQEHIPDLSLVLAGNRGPGSEAVRAAVSRVPGLGDRVHFTGFVPDEDLAALYSGAMALLYPSIYEGFGLPPLEAMQCGTPVVTSNSSSLPEVVGDAGIMIDPGDEDALCDAVLTLYRDDALRASLGQAARERAASFTWERSIEQTLSAYRAVMTR
jgi:glycosyltransferase involved in cell wall biosynthesis